MTRRRSHTYLGVAAVALAVVLVATACSSNGGTAEADAGTERTYFVAADEVPWNYTPTGKNGITGEAFGDQEDTYVAAGPDRIGATYKKSQYREYTDATFSTVKSRPAAWEHLGMADGGAVRPRTGQ